MHVFGLYHWYDGTELFNLNEDTALDSYTFMDDSRKVPIPKTRNWLRTFFVNLELFLSRPNISENNSQLQSCAKKYIKLGCMV